MNKLTQTLEAICRLPWLNGFTELDHQIMKFRHLKDSYSKDNAGHCQTWVSENLKKGSVCTP